MKHFIKKAFIVFWTIIQLFALGMPLPVYAADMETVEEKSTPSGITYSDLGEKIQKYIAERESGTASVSLAVFDHREILYQSYYGYANIDQKLAADENTVYEWGSVSKLLVWVSVMQLFEQGKIDLDKNIKEYLPKDFLTKLAYGSPITMINLMNHTAGWQEITYDIETKDVSQIVPLDKALKMSEPAQIYKPGTVCAYSNWGTSLAAYIVECISGEDFYVYVKKNIFAPLGMEHTSLAPDCSDNLWVQEQRKLLNCYSITSESYEDYGKCISYILLYPSGSATGTLKDYLAFARSFVPDKNERCPFFKNKDTLNIMLSATSNYGDSAIPRNCHGLWALPYSVNILGHNGNTAGCTSTLMFEPESGAGIVIMTNEYGETAYNYGLLSLLFGEYAGDGTSITKSTDLSGIFTMARTYEKGFPRIYHILGSLMPLSKTEDKNVYKLSIGQGKLTQKSNNQYIMDNENGWKYLMYLDKTEDGQLELQMMSSDCLKENTLVFALKLLLVLLGFFAFLYAIIASIRIILCAAIKKLRHKEHDTRSCKIFDISRVVTLLSILMNAFMIYLVIFLPLNGGSVKLQNVWWKCIIIGLLSFIPVGNTVVLFIKNKSFEGTGKQKSKYILTAVFGWLLSLNVWYWQMFDFWSC